MKKFIQYIPFLLILTVASVLFIRVNMDGKDAADAILGDSQMVGKEVADYALDKILPAADKGRNVDKGYFRGGYVVINFFASWCVACQHEHPLIKGLKGIEGVKILGVAWRDKEADALEWLDRNGNPYSDVALDDLGKFGIMMGVTGIPETFIIDNNGKIIKHYGRVVNEDDIKEIREIVSR